MTNKPCQKQIFIILQPSLSFCKWLFVIVGVGNLIMIQQQVNNFVAVSSQSHHTYFVIYFHRGKSILSQATMNWWRGLGLIYHITNACLLRIYWPYSSKINCIAQAKVTCQLHWKWKKGISCTFQSVMVKTNWQWDVSSSLITLEKWTRGQSKSVHRHTSTTH